MHRTIRVALWGVITLCLVPLSSWGLGKTTLSGFVDTSFFYENVGETNTFGLDQVELDVETEITPWAGLRLDINFNSFASGKEIEVGIFDELTADEVVEQGYVTLVVPTEVWGFDTLFQFGKFADDAVVGWEELEPLDIYQFSFALLSDVGIPFPMTGALVTLTFSPSVGLQLYAINGWGNSQDNNTMKTFGGRLDVSPLAGLYFGFNALTGPEQDDNNDDYRTLLDMDVTVEMIPRLLIGAEINYGHEENIAFGAGDATWLAGLLTLHYAVTDIVGLTFRFDIFDDPDGVRLFRDNETVTDETRYALTFASTFTLAEKVRALLEFRYAQSDEDVFQKPNGNFIDNVFSVAIEFTFGFEHVLQ